MVYTDLARLTRRKASLGRRSRARQILVLTAALVCACTWPAAADIQAHVRSTDREMLQLIKEGTERSVTFRALVDDINRSDGIVYVERGICAFGRVNGCVLPFMTATHGNRYIRILVTPDIHRVSHDQVLALIAHELQHAREVIEHADVTDVATMEAMYSKIGTQLIGQKGYETSAARAAGDTVLGELLAKHASR